MTSDELTKQVVAELGLQEISAYNESSLVAGWLYQGTLDLLSRTRCVVRCVHLNVTANNDQYTLDHSILSLVDVENGARPRAHRADCDDLYSFVLVRSDVLLVRPTPSVNGTLEVWAVMKPQKLVNPTDDLGSEQFGAIPDEYQDAVLLYALWKGSSYSDDQSGSQGERYRVQYEGADGRGGRLGQIRVMVNKRGTGRASRARVRLSRLSPNTSWL